MFEDLSIYGPGTRSERFHRALQSQKLAAELGREEAEYRQRQKRAWRRADLGAALEPPTYSVDGNAPATLREITGASEDWPLAHTEALLALLVGESAYLGGVEVRRVS